jgi:hypothetical protein
MTKQPSRDASVSSSRHLSTDDTPPAFERALLQAVFSRHATTLTIARDTPQQTAVGTPQQTAPGSERTWRLVKHDRHAGRNRELRVETEPAPTSPTLERLRWPRDRAPL